MVFYYIRHGDPIYDPDSLTERGHKQAEALAKRLALYGLDEIYTSNSTRAQLTAEPILKVLGKEKTVVDWAHEGFTYNNFTVPSENGGLEFAFCDHEYTKKFNSKEVRAWGEKWYEHPDFANNTFAEGLQKVNEKVDEFFAAQGFVHDRENGCYKVTKKNEKRVALFAHAGNGMVVLSSILDIPYSLLASHFDISHSGVTVIYFDDKWDTTIPRVLQWSNDSHLYKEEILSGYNNGMNI